MFIVNGDLCAIGKSEKDAEDGELSEEQAIQPEKWHFCRQNQEKRQRERENERVFQTQCCVTASSPCCH